MSRKPLFTDIAKDIIAGHLLNRSMTVTELANLYNCHPRSINRVAEEKGVARTTSKVAIETQRVKKILAQAGINADQLGQLMILLMANKATDPDVLRVKLNASVWATAESTAAKSKTAALFQAGAQTAASITANAAAA